MKTSLHEEISVLAETPGVDRTSTTTVTKISNQVTEVLPLKRSLGDIIKMTPGVVDGRIGGANVSISGASGWENTFIINGVNVSNPGFGGLGTFTPAHLFMLDNGLPLDSILETQIITAGFEPEYGESQGGVVNVITKSGGNQFHGSTHFYSTPYADQTVLSGVNYEIETGAELGGPILKDKLFFHGAYTLTASKTTNFLDPELPGYSVLPEYPEKSYNNAYSFKISANPKTNHSLEFSAIGSPSFLPLSIHDGWQLDTAVNPNMAASEWHFGNNSQQLRWSGALKSNFFIEAQVGRAYDEFIVTPTPLSENVPRTRDFTQGIDIGGFGGDTNFFDTNWQYGVKFTSLWNRHQFRYGLQFEDIDHSEANHRTGGVFVFPDGSVAQNGYIVFKKDEHVYQVNAGVPGIETQTTTKYVYSFVQDSWDITSRFNINLGLRWEQQILREDQENRRVNFGNNWAPRIGATYDYLNNGNSRLFFHYGRFYERLPNYAAAFLSTFYNANAYFSDPELTDLIGYDPATKAAYFTGRASLEFEGHENSDSPFVAKLAYTNEWSGGIEQEIQPGFSLRANVVFRKLERALDTVGLTSDVPCEPASNCYPPPQTLENWFNGSGSFYIFTNVDGHIPGIPALERNYGSFQLSVEKRFSDQWQILGSYTYARLTGNYAGDDRSGAADFAVSAMAPFNYVSGPLPNDIRHVVKLFGNYQLQNLNTGIAFYFQTGSPRTKSIGLSQDPVGFVSSFILEEPRGASGRADSITNIDLHADYNLPGFRDQKFTIGADVFNVFNSQGVIVFEDVEGNYYGHDPELYPNPDFLNPTEIQQPRTYRILLRYSF